MNTAVSALPQIGVPLRQRVTWDQIVPGIGPFIRTITASETLEIGHSHVLVNAVGGAVTVTLPPVRLAYREVTVKKIDASANVVTVDGDGAETIDDAATASLAAQYNYIRLVSDGTEWWKVGG